MDIGHAFHHLGIGFRRTLCVSLPNGKLVVLAYWIYVLLFQAYYSPNNRAATRIEEDMLGFGCTLPIWCESYYSIQERALRYGTVFQFNVTWCNCLANTSTGTTNLTLRVERQVFVNHDRVPPAWYLFIICLGLTVVKFLKHHSDAVPSALANAWKRIRIGQDATVTDNYVRAGNEWNGLWIADEMSIAVSSLICLLATLVDPPQYSKWEVFILNDQSFWFGLLLLLRIVITSGQWLFNAESIESVGCHQVDRGGEAKDARWAITRLSPHKLGCGLWIEASVAALPDTAILLGIWISTWKQYPGQLREYLFFFLVNEGMHSKKWRINMMVDPESYIAACMVFEVIHSRGLGRFVTMTIRTRVFPFVKGQVKKASLFARELHWCIKRGAFGGGGEDDDDDAIGNYLAQADTIRRRTTTS
eukprot:scpid77262/ scgid9181/ 